MFGTIILHAAFLYSALGSNNENLKSLFEDFKKEHQKTYISRAEESLRFDVFVNNLRLIEERNDLERLSGGSAVHGITQFADLSPTEFENIFLNYIPSSEEDDVETIFMHVNASAGLVDWTGKYTTAIKNQGGCGSCWAHAATEQIESDAIRLLGKSYQLSTQQATSCDKNSGGCNGGSIESAYNYVKQVGGIETESAYPYTSSNGVTGTCSANASKFVVGVSAYTHISGETSMASYVQSTGPLAIVIDASTLGSYKGGIISTCGTNINHAVQAVGVDASSNGYWKVRNSWGSTWGESGYFRMAYNKNMCAMAKYAASNVTPKKL